jgi:hypothetical protein
LALVALAGRIPLVALLVEIATLSIAVLCRVAVVYLVVTILQHLQAFLLVTVAVLVEGLF